MPDLYSANGILVTSNEDAFGDLSTGRIRHAGLIFIPKSRNHGAKVRWAGFVEVFVRQVGRNRGRFGVRGIALYPGCDGVRARNRHWDGSLQSWDVLA